jgi:predicted NACHT family NTPase
VKQKIADDIRERCGTMRVLDMTQPVDLDRIYTDVNIIKDVIGRRRIGYDEVLEVCTREHFDRFLVGTIQKRVKGIKAVDEIQKLVVLGKPGAGKTTFMKYLAMSCLGGRFHGELVPIFVTLKAYAEERGQPSLENYILTEFQKRDVAADVAKRLLKEGRALILLDGLDEVKLEDDRRVKQEIDQFSRDWLKNRFAITCRIAAREYQFDKFTEVEVADFDDGQIETFVNNWFRQEDESKAEQLLERFKENKPVKELAKSPLLLTLLCLVFDKTNKLPVKQYKLFEEGLYVLLKIWDGKRDIERDFPKHFKGEQIYRNLTCDDKVNMIEKIAFNSFMNGEYFFRQEDLQRQIKDYICNLPEASSDPEALRLDSEAVLKAIEHHHGLLVERARNIYSFSHLTFQEYFTAREVKRERQWESLMKYSTEPRWKEVFLLTAEMLTKSDDFLRLMKDCIDGMLGDDKKFQAFLEWVNQKTNSEDFGYKTVAVRAMYLNFYVERGRAGPLAEALDANTSWDYWEYPYGTYNRIFDSERCINEFLNNFCPSYKHFLDLVIDNSYPQLLDFWVTIRRIIDKFRNKQEDYHQWWESHGEEWKNEFRQKCINHLNIGHDWQFTERQKELLNQYYAANLLLVECMNRSYVSKQVREEIESTMLLPSKK